jgi:hypothetical protein
MTQRTLTTLLATALLAIAGCANPSVITLNDGTRIQTVDIPNSTKTPVSTSSKSSTANRLG